MTAFLLLIFLLFIFVGIISVEDLISSKIATGRLKDKNDIEV